MAFDETKRSELMSKIRSQNTQAELIVFRYLRKENIYFQRHYNRVVGRPDIALPRKKIAIFIDGDFWHGRELQRLKERGGSEVWIKKLETNMKRDQENTRTLESMHWKVLRVWESDLKIKRTRYQQLEQIKNFLIENY